MPPPNNRRPWRTFFRRLRIAFGVFLLLLVCAALYLNQIGLPGFLKRPLLDRLHAQGIDLEFSRLRWQWFRGIVAEDVRFTRAKEPLGPQLSAKEVELNLNGAALKKFDLQVSSLVLQNANFIWPVLETNQPPRELAIHKIQTELHLFSDDRWELENFQAEFRGGKLSLSGSLTNASALREWLFQPKRKKPPRFQNRLSQFVKTLDEIQFSSSSELKVLIQGDGRDAKSFRGSVVLSVPDAATPWGAVSNSLFTAHIFAGQSNEVSHAELKFRATTLETKWNATVPNNGLSNSLISARDFQLTADLILMNDDTNKVHGNLTASVGKVETGWGSATNVLLTAQWIHSLTNAILAGTNVIPISGHGDLRFEEAQTQWGDAKKIHLVTELVVAEPNASMGDESWGWWRVIAPYPLRWKCELAGISGPKLEADEFICSGTWRAPELAVDRIHSQLYDGQLDATATLNVQTRAVRAEASSDFEAHKISPLLTAGARRWINKLSWEQPPTVHGAASVILPAWTNHHPDWRGEVQPTLELSGEFSSGKGAYKGAPVSTAHSHFAYSNLVWTLPDLSITRPEGGAELFYRVNDRTKDFYWKIRAAIDPKVLRPLLETNAQRGLDYFELTSPPRVDGEVWGRLNEPQQTSFRGQIGLSNFTFRGESALSFDTKIDLTNSFINFLEPELSRSEGYLLASAVGFDVTAKKFYFTNGFSIADPMAVARAIGKKAAKSLEPYQFLKPPTIYAHGTLELRPTGKPDLADLEFKVNGGPFHWMKFNATHIDGTVLWQNQTLVLTNVKSDFYDGKLSGDAGFDFSSRQGADFQFEVRGSNLNFHRLMTDLAGGRTKLEGLLNGNLAVTNVNTRDTQSWQGYGSVHLRNGMIWEMPIFGIFSPVLNMIWPGLGHTRVSEGKAKFVITNSVIYSDDMEFRALALRMSYRGTVDFDQNVNARVTAELLRDVWGIGPIVSTVFWPITKMFEYKVTGSLTHPKMEPLYLFPKLLLFPFQPFHLMKGLLFDKSNEANPSPEHYRFEAPDTPKK